MSWKPNEHDIIDYLYGELTPEALQRFDDYRQQNPEFAREVNEFRLTQGILPALADEEVIPPVPLVDSNSPTPVVIANKKWLYPVSIAASVAAILIAGYFSQLNLSFDENGFKMAFGNNIQSPQETVLTPTQINALIDNKVKLASAQWREEASRLEVGFAAQLAKNKKLTAAEIKKVAARKSPEGVEDEQILAFITQLQEENKRMMQNFYQASAAEQQKYMRNILLEFNTYLDQQRQQDLQFIQANMLELKSSSELKQEATDKILASIITTVNKQNSPGQ
jgi:hypothetical protein